MMAETFPDMTIFRNGFEIYPAPMCIACFELQRTNVARWANCEWQVDKELEHGGDPRS
jgi:hypothetical protein